MASTSTPYPHSTREDDVTRGSAASVAPTEDTSLQRSGSKSILKRPSSAGAAVEPDNYITSESTDPDTIVLAPKKSVSFSRLYGREALKMVSTTDRNAQVVDQESSEDEHTSMLSSQRGSGQNYSTVEGPGNSSSARSSGVEEPAGPAGFLKKRKDTGKGKQTDALDPPSTSSWWSDVKQKYGSIELENKGSVARDHLALERTFLAWLRTSLSFASIGIAVTQLFRLNTSIGNIDPNHPALNHLRRVGKPLGATFIAIAIVVLFIGFHRYFEAQHYVIRGKFPASRGSVLLISVLTFALTVVSLTVILVIGGSSLAT